MLLLCGHTASVIWGVVISCSSVIYLKPSMGLMGTKNNEQVQEGSLQKVHPDLGSHATWAAEEYEPEASQSSAPGPVSPEGALPHFLAVSQTGL